MVKRGYALIVSVFPKHFLFDAGRMATCRREEEYQLQCMEDTIMSTWLRKFSVVVVLMGFPLVFAGCGDDDSPTNPEEFQNNFPTVQGIQISPDAPVYADDTITLQAVTDDPDNDVLRYTWAKNAGDFDPAEAVGESVQWTAPSANGNYQVTVVGDDGNGGTSQKHLDIPVYGGNQSGSIDVVGGVRLNPVGGETTVGYVDAGDTITLVWDKASTVTTDSTRPDETKYAPDGSQLDSETMAVKYEPQFGYAEELPSENGARYSIVGKFDGGEWFAFTPGADTDADGIPNSFSAVAPNRGKVYLSINEQKDLLMDNTGYWRMSFTITHP